MEERLQKFLADCGVASRRKCEQLIIDGYITVNGDIIKTMGKKINTDIDVVSYKGKIIKKGEYRVYIMMNKPAEYITTTKEQFGRKKVVDLLTGINFRVYPIGRLDYNSSGLLLLTNDGEMAFKLTHPGHEIDKTYIVELNGIPSKEDIEKLRQGIIIDGRITAPAVIHILRIGSNKSELKFVIHEGRNRQIRKMCSAIGYDVISLKRIAIGKLELGNLKNGEYRMLTNKEINYLKGL